MGVYLLPWHVDSSSTIALTMLTEKETHELFGNRIRLKASWKLRPFNPGAQYTNTDITVVLKQSSLCVFLTFTRQMLVQQATLRHDVISPLELTTYNNCLNAVQQTQNEDTTHQPGASGTTLRLYLADT